MKRIRACKYFVAFAFTAASSFSGSVSESPAMEVDRSKNLCCLYDNTT